MKTLSFFDYQVGRFREQVLLNLNSDAGGPTFSSGLQLMVAPNGYGKTTFLQTLSGLVQPLSGEVKWDGHRLSAEEQVFYFPEFLAFPKYIYPTEWVSLFSGSGKTSEVDLEPWWKGFGLEKLKKRYLGQMSQGERRKVNWLAAHASRRPVLLLDEPLNGLDFLSIQMARKMLEEWKREGRMIVLATHQVGELLDLSKEIYLVREGKLVPWRSWNQTPVDQVEMGLFRSEVLRFYQENRVK